MKRDGLLLHVFVLAAIIFSAGLYLSYPVYSTYIPNLCAPLVTGQTISYQSGDDGDLELGVAKDYSTYTTGQYNLSSDIVINGKTHELSNNCVQDNRTGLMWARYVPNADIGPAADGRLFWKEYTVTDTDIAFDNGTSKINRAGGDWVVAPLCVGRRFTISGTDSNDGTYNITAVDVNDITVAEALTNEIAGDTVVVTTVDDLIWDALDQANANSLGGYTDWRIPNYFELPSIVHLGNCNPAINTTVFPSTPSDYHWTSSTHPCSSANAFVVNFYHGGMHHGNKQTVKHHVRFVRSG